MKLRILLTALFLMSFVAPVMADQAVATINAQCAPVNATITVPAGKTAVAFSVSGLAAGAKCTVGGIPDVKGWGIKLGGNKV